MPTPEEQFTEALKDVNDTLEEVKVTLVEVRDVMGVKTIDAENVPNRVMVTDGSGNTTTSSITTTQLNYLSDLTGNVQAQLDNKLANKLAYTNGVLITDSNGNIVTHSTVGVSELGRLDGITDNIMTLLDKRMPRVTDNKNGVLVTGADGAVMVHLTVDYGTLGKLAGVTDNVQTQLNDKANVGGWTASKVVVTDASGNLIANPNVSWTEVNMLKGVKSNLQTQIDDKQSQISSVSSKVAINTIVGEVKWLAFSDSVGGWLLCDGRAVSRTDYADLFAAIGTTWGEGDGSTTFNLPNLIDKTVWGGTTAGSYKEAGLPNIEGELSNFVGTTQPTSSGALSIAATGSTLFTNEAAGDFTTHRLRLDASSDIYGKSTTVQPPAAVLRPVIKY